MREVAFTNVTKMRTTWRKSGTITAWKSCRTSKLATRAAASPTARMSGTAESRAIAMIRRVPNKYRKVRPLTTQTLRTASARPVRSPHQISEDRRAGGCPLDLVEHLGRHEDVTAGLGEFRGRPEELDPGQRVGARERLVEDQDLRSVGERLGEFRSLAHPAAIGPGGTLRRAR